MTAMNFKMLNSLRFGNIYNWSVHYANYIEKNYSEKFKLVKIGDFLIRSKKPIEIQDRTIYKRVKIRINGGGISVRDEILGDEIGTKSQFIVETNQFLLSKIDARNGAFGVVPHECDGAVITGNFWTFDVDYQQINPHFLKSFTSTKHFQEVCQRASNGTTNRNYLQEGLFLEMEIPLPDVDTQNQLVKQYNENLAKAQNAQIQADELEKRIEKYLFEALGIEIPEKKETKLGLQMVRFNEISRWGVEFLNDIIENPFFSQKYEMVNFKDYVFINPKVDFSEYDDDSEITFIPMEVISDHYGELKEYRKTKIKIKDSKGYTKIGEGDLIWAKITPCMENGKSAIVKNLNNKFACGSTEFHVFRSKSEDISLDFIYTLLRSDYLKTIAKKHFTGSAGQQRVPAQFFKDLEIPLVPKDIQTQIVNHIKESKEKIKNLSEQSERLKREAKEDFEKEIFA